VKLLVMIPALNEQHSVGDVIKAIPRHLDGISSVEVLLLDDGSTDATAEVARQAGCEHIISFRKSRGLARAFKTGLDEALRLGADIIVNIDADNQYDPREMPRLIQPILHRKADIVLGSRFAGTIETMPLRKRLGNRIATMVTRFLCNLPISDAQTGYRAFSREAAMRLNILSFYTYTQETIVQAVYKKLHIVEVPVTFRRRAAGESRLVLNIFGYAGNTAVTLIRTFMSHQALKVLSLSGGFLMLAGLALGIRVLIHFFSSGAVGPYIPSAIASGFLIVFGFQLTLLGLVADMVRNNRELLEDTLYQMRRETGTKEHS